MTLFGLMPAPAPRVKPTQHFLLDRGADWPSGEERITKDKLGGMLKRALNEAGESSTSFLAEIAGQPTSRVLRVLEELKVAGEVSLREQPYGAVVIRLWSIARK